MIQKLLAVAILLFSLAANAQSGEVILLIKPPTTNGALQEAFNRLKGELSLHGFHVVVEQSDADVDALSLEDLADKVGAVASVSFVPLGPYGSLSRVEVWIGDRVSGTTLKRTILPGRGEQAPSVLSLRALELLRSSLQAHEDDEPDETVEGAHPARAQEAVEQLKSVNRSSNEVFVAAGVALAISLPDGGPSFGPQYALGIRRKFLGVRILGQGPLLGTSAQTEGAQFDAWTLELSFEPLIIPVATDRWSFFVFPSVGATLLKINGEATPPYSGREDSRWVSILGGGIEAAYHFNETLAVAWSARIRSFAPTPVVVLADEQRRLGSPQLSSSLGLMIVF